jgi:hypothetical protein
MGEFGWRLLASAAQGDIDVEALTELQAAWRSPCAAELLKNDKTWVPMRSVWAIVEASRALGDGGDAPSFGEAGRRMEALWPVKAASLRGRPELKELAALAKAVRDAAKKPAEDVLAELKKSPDQPAPYLRALYATLALSDDAEFVAKAAPLLTTARPDGSPLASAPTVAAALLAPSEKIDSKSLADVIAKRVSGEDMVVLTALASRRAGGDAWNAFRVASKDLLGSQPLDGSVIVLVNSLARANLPVVVAAK